MDLHLDGKSALVTGSTVGIGFAIAEALAREGVRVAVNGRTPARVNEAVARIGRAAHGVVADFVSAEGQRPSSRRCPRSTSS